MKLTKTLVIGQILTFVLVSEAQINFTDVSKGLSLADSSEGTGVAWCDYNKDGRLDIYLVNHDGANKLFKNVDLKSFVDASLTDHAKIAALEDTSEGDGAAWGDLGNDGDLDLYLSNRKTSNKLIERQGSDQYVDITRPPLDDVGNGTGVAWGDYDNDGQVDLYLANRDGANRLFRNLGDKTFKRAIIPILEDASASWGVAWADYDNDADLDLYVANENGANKLFRNDGGNSFAEVVGAISDVGIGRGVAWGDYDNDGDFDLYLSNEAGGNKLFENMGNDVFTDVTDASGPLGDTDKGRSVAWGDFDNDGDLDLYLVNNSSSNKLFLNNGDQTFIEATTSPLDDDGPGSGMAVADYDDDGDLDIYQASFGGPNRLFRNELDPVNAWLKVKLVRNNTQAAVGVGARIRILADGLWQTRQISGGSGFLSQDAQVAHFGLEGAAVVDSVVVVWPSGLRQIRTGVAVNQTLVLQEVFPEALPAPQGVELQSVPNTPFLIVSWEPPAIPDAPTLSAPSTENVGPCVLADGTVGVRVRVSLSYSDSSGDVNDATRVKLTAELSSFGARVALADTSVVPGTDGSSGTLSFDLCVFFGDETFVQIAVSILDAVGNSSNYLRFELKNPEIGPSSTTAFSDISGETVTIDTRFSVATQRSNAAASQGLELVEYRVYRFKTEMPEGESLIATVPAADTSFVDEGTEPDIGYTYLVSAVYQDLGESKKTKNENFAGIDDTELFAPITEGVIFDNINKSQSCSWGDIDSDGDLDVFVSNQTDNRNFLFRNMGGGTFLQVQEGDILYDLGDSKGSSFADFDKDGDLDLFVANLLQENFLYQNNNGVFARLTDASRYPMVADANASFNGAWGDFDNDGYLDLFVANGLKDPNRLFRNKGDNTFEEFPLRDALGNVIDDVARSTGGFWGDYNNDGFLDLFVTNKGGNNFLYQNNGDKSFTRITTGAVVNDGGDSRGASWGDFNNDGFLDLFVANGKDSQKNRKNFLYRNLGPDANYDFFKIEQGVIAEDENESFGSSWGDFDNDGDLDLLVANEDALNVLYRNDGGDTFTKLEEVKNSGNSRGASWGDYTDDGFLDMLLLNMESSNQNAHNLLYENLKTTAYHWVKIRARGSVSNASAIGVRIRVKATIKGTPVWQMREISAVTGWGSQNSLEQLFGLGDATVIDSIVVHWPASNRTQYLTGMSVDMLLVIDEDDANPTAVESEMADIPAVFALHPNFPNPFNPETTLRYDLPEPARVRLTIYSILGQKIATLVDARQPAGFYSVRWSGLNDVGVRVASGIYIARLEAVGAQSFVGTKKMLLLK